MLLLLSLRLGLPVGSFLLPYRQLDRLYLLQRVEGGQRGEAVVLGRGGQRAEACLALLRFFLERSGRGGLAASTWGHPVVVRRVGGASIMLQGSFRPRRVGLDVDDRVSDFAGVIGLQFELDVVVDADLGRASTGWQLLVTPRVLLVLGGSRGQVCSEHRGQVARLGSVELEEASAARVAHLDRVVPGGLG